MKKKFTNQPLNMHGLAVMITILEGKKVSLDIAQIKEVLRILVAVKKSIPFKFDLVFAEAAQTLDNEINSKKRKKNAKPKKKSK